MYQDIYLPLIILLIYFIVKYVRTVLKLKLWRKRLERNDFVKLYYMQRWHVAIIRKFFDNGKTVHLLLLHDVKQTIVIARLSDVHPVKKL